jgi:hypothetical protein
LYNVLLKVICETVEGLYFFDSAWNGSQTHCIRLVRARLDVGGCDGVAEIIDLGCPEDELCEVEA